MTIVLVAVPSALIFAFRVVMVLLGRALYISLQDGWRQLDGLASTSSTFVVPVHFFVQMRHVELLLLLLLSAEDLLAPLRVAGGT